MHDRTEPNRCLDGRGTRGIHEELSERGGELRGLTELSGALALATVPGEHCSTVLRAMTGPCVQTGRVVILRGLGCRSTVDSADTGRLPLLVPPHLTSARCQMMSDSQMSDAAVGPLSGQKAALPGELARLLEPCTMTIVHHRHECWRTSDYPPLLVRTHRGRTASEGYVCVQTP